MEKPNETRLFFLHTLNLKKREEGTQNFTTNGDFHHLSAPENRIHGFFPEKNGAQPHAAVGSGELAKPKLKLKIRGPPS